RAARLALSSGRGDCLALRSEIRRTCDARRRGDGARGPTNWGKEGQEGPLESLENRLSPWVSFVILPIFAFANAGVSLTGLSAAQVVSPIPLGIALGLFIGKPLGIYTCARVAISSGIGAMPAGASQVQLFGTAILGGIGFTMSLFI